jgi:hypothetical protein
VIQGKWEANQNQHRKEELETEWNLVCECRV